MLWEKDETECTQGGKVTESQSPLKLSSHPLAPNLKKWAVQQYIFATNHLVSSLFLQFGQF